MSNDLVWLLGSDVHFPLHDRRKLDLFMQVMKHMKPNAVDYLGDIDDASCTSRWAEGTPAENISVLKDGVAETTELFRQTREILPEADIHYHDGNHGWTRHRSYLEKKAPAFLEVVTPESLYKYEQYGVAFHYYQEKPVHRFGDMYGHHGFSISKHSAESVRNDCMTRMISLVRGHSHRMGAYYNTFDMPGLMIRGYEIGHMCDESKMLYQDDYNWQPGFAVAHVENGNFPHMQLIQITRDYTCCVDGKFFYA